MGYMKRLFTEMQEETRNQPVPLDPPEELSLDPSLRMLDLLCKELESLGRRR